MEKNEAVFDGKPVFQHVAVQTNGQGGQEPAHLSRCSKADRKEAPSTPLVKQPVTAVQIRIADTPTLPYGEKSRRYADVVRESFRPMSSSEVRGVESGGRLVKSEQGWEHPRSQSKQQKQSDKEREAVLALCKEELETERQLLTKERQGVAEWEREMERRMRESHPQAESLALTYAHLLGVRPLASLTPSHLSLLSPSGLQFVCRHPTKICQLGSFQPSNKFTPARRNASVQP